MIFENLEICENLEGLKICLLLDLSFEIFVRVKTTAFEGFLALLAILGFLSVGIWLDAFD